MPPKFHYLKESVGFSCVHKMPGGYCDEQGLEGMHVIFNECRRAYSNQLDILRVQYMLEKIYLITSPKYCQMYTNGKSNN